MDEINAKSIKVIKDKIAALTEYKEGIESGTWPLDVSHVTRIVDAYVEDLKVAQADRENVYYVV